MSVSTSWVKASLLEAYGEELAALGATRPELLAVEEDPDGSSFLGPFRARWPDRCLRLGGGTAARIDVAAGLALGGRTVFLHGPALALVARSYGDLRQAVGINRADVKLVATEAGLLTPRSGAPYQLLEDLGLVRGLPGMTVVVPADAPTARSAARAIAEFHGPAYLRLSSEPLPTVTDGSFRLGEARELRPGTDLTLIAIGALVARALEVAEELHRVGVEARVLDLASFKPFDEKAILRAARETGALLTLEEHSVLTGLGSLVAATTSENYPVPVRRLGVPDLFGESGEPWALLDRFGLAKERALDEAWELLKGRGKFH
jgi:transketolase